MTHIKDELVTFETAKLAKEKEFDGECNHYYNNYPPTRNNSPRGLIQGKVYQDHNGETLEDGELLCSAPTQSLLQKWLREIHNLDVSLSLNQFGYGYMFAINDCKQCKNIKELVGGCNFKYTYEQALEIGLQEALKLI